MSVDDRADLAAGLLVALLGGAVAIYAASSYDLGTLRRMGPGMFPMGLGVLMAALGLMLALGAARRTRAPLALARDRIGVEFRSAALATAGVIAFGLLIRPAGLILAVLAVVIIPAFADRKNRLLPIMVLAMVLTGLAVAIFPWLLGLPIPLLPMGMR
ncbi:tripartite tricarboxylate transporter TctB family protein [Paracoccus hibiscisoli]|nr:tripartite tricarboxylate transporter TctB family protein [Paracoccus hibiscisoli]